MAPIMFACLVLLLLIGYPVAFAARRQSAWSSASSASRSDWSSPALFQALPERVFGILFNESCCWRSRSSPSWALILERCGLAEDLLDTMGQLFGPVRGGLAYAVIFVGGLLGGHHRHGGRLGDRDGPDLAAGDAALRLRPAACRPA